MRRQTRGPQQRIEPGAGQESVWDYPRPPRVEPVSERIVIRLGGGVVADTREAYRVLETSHPPVYYLPPSAFAAGALGRAPGSSMCEFKGAASYWDITATEAAADHVTARAAGWSYEQPWPGYEMLRGHIAVYPSAMDSCEVAGERVQAQDGDFYGGWITSRVVGPFKGAPGTLGW